MSIYSRWNLELSLKIVHIVFLPLWWDHGILTSILWRHQWDCRLFNLVVALNLMLCVNVLTRIWHLRGLKTIAFWNWQNGKDKAMQLILKSVIVYGLLHTPSGTCLENFLFMYLHMLAHRAYRIFPLYFVVGFLPFSSLFCLPVPRVKPSFTETDWTIIFCQKRRFWLYSFMFMIFIVLLSCLWYL